jgi:hypothetical protein
MRLAYLIIFLLAFACARTEDKLLTAKELCRDKQKLNDPENFRDEYDNCLLFVEEELITNDGCEGRCATYCTKRSMELKEYLIGFGGCRCTCSVTLAPG